MNKEEINKRLSFLIPEPNFLKMKLKFVGQTRKDLIFFYENLFLCSVFLVSGNEAYTSIQSSLFSDEINKMEAILQSWDGS